MGHEPGIDPSLRLTALARLIREERERRSLSRRELAELVCAAARADGERGCRVGEQTVERWEKGRRPRPDHLRWLAAALELPVEHLSRLAGKIAPEEDDTERRTFSRLAALSLAGVVLPGGLDMERLTLPAVDALYVRDAETVTTALLDQWYGTGAAVLLPPALAHLGALQRALPGSPELENLTGRTALLTGYLFSKLERYGDARAYFALAESLARDTNDDRLRALTLIARSSLHSWRRLNNRTRSWALVSEAAASLDADAPGLLRAAVLSRRAEERAALGDADGFARDMASAEAALSPGADHWYGPRDAAELAAIRGASELLLGRRVDAAQTLTWTLERMNPRAVNWRALVARDRDAALAAADD